jgi:hypothetical protein
MRLTPTDVSQFVRLEQCERFLRFRLAERAGQQFMEEYDVTPQRITPLLSLSGHEFEEGVEKALGSHFRNVHFAARASQDHSRPDNNREIVTEASKLQAGQQLVHVRVLGQSCGDIALVCSAHGSSSKFTTHSSC